MFPLKLITESIDIQSLEYLSEGEGSNKVFKIKGPMLVAEVLNGNNRKYKKPTLKREVDRFLKEPKENRIGEWTHPQSALINRERAAIIVESLVEDGNNFIGIAKVLTKWPCGRVIYNSLEEGLKVGMSSRSLGTVDESTRYVNDNMRLVTIDGVETPSGPGCFVDGILEGKNYIISGDIIVEQAVANLQKKLDRNGSKEISKYLKEFINSIK